MKDKLYNNDSIISWLKYFADNAPVDLETIKMLDVTGKNKNMIPTVMTHESVMVFTKAGDMDIFYRMWNAGLGDCEVWYNEGSEPEGQIYHKPLREMIDRGINASAGMLIINPNATSSYRIGIDNADLIKGSVRYESEEIRTIILNKMHINKSDNIVTVTAASIAVESSILAPEGQIVAVEYTERDRNTVEENMKMFGLSNVVVKEAVNEETMKGLPVPDIAMIVASDNMEKELDYLVSVNPDIRFVIYTVDFYYASRILGMLRKAGIKEADITQVQISKLNNKNQMVPDLAPWIISSKN